MQLPSFAVVALLACGCGQPRAAPQADKPVAAPGAPPDAAAAAERDFDLVRGCTACLAQKRYYSGGLCVDTAAQCVRHTYCYGGTFTCPTDLAGYEIRDPRDTSSP